MAYNILVVDDEKLIIKGIKLSLQQEGMKVDEAYDGEEALELFSKSNYDLIILDVMLPKKDGLEVCQQIRSESDVPIIMLTAKGDEIDKIMGLDCGADDYMTKPFNILELKARIKAILRRSIQKVNVEEPEAKNKLTTGDLAIDLVSRRVFIEEKEIYLTAKEFDLLELLAKHIGRVYSREELLNAVWGYDCAADVRTVDVHIRRLREKIEKTPSEPKYIYTKWGVGYYFQ